MKKKQELLRMQLLAGIITESQQKQLLENMEVVDRILDKISSQGEDSITPEEKEYLDKYSKGEELPEPPIEGEEEEESNPPNVKMVIDDYKSSKEELKSMGKERNKYSQAFAEWAKTKIKGINFGQRSLYSFYLAQLFGLTERSRYQGKKNFLPVEVLEDWKSKDDPKYKGLLVYVGRTIDP